MASRPSLIKQQLVPSLAEARDKLLGLYLSDSPIDLPKIAGCYIDPLRTAAAEFTGQIRKDVRSRVSIAADNNLHLVFPILNRHGAQRVPAWEGRDKPFMTWQNYLSSVGSDNTGKFCAGLALTYTFDSHCVPLRWGSQAVFGEVIDTPEEAFVLCPDSIGTERFEQYAPHMERIYNLLLMCQYKQTFGTKAAVYITTPGLCKKVWPEAPAWLPNNGAPMGIWPTTKASSWPVGLRRVLDDLGMKHAADHLKTGVTTKYMHKQLESVGDMILSAKLAPPLHELWDDMPSITEVDVTPVSISTEYMERYTKLIPSF